MTIAQKPENYTFWLRVIFKNNALYHWYVNYFNLALFSDDNSSLLEPSI